MMLEKFAKCVEW